MELGNCILVGAGDLTVTEIPVGENDICIAVDGGYEYCKLLEIVPDYIIGDFDSLGEENNSLETAKEYLKENVISLPREKDETDMFAALKLGLSLGFKDFRIYAGMGGRLEHTFANIQCLHYLKERGATGYLMDGTGMVLVLKEESVSFRENLEGYLSIFSLSDSCNISLDNLKYCLENKEITNTFPLGISNEFIPGKKSTVAVHKGTAVLMLNWI